MLQYYFYPILFYLMYFPIPKFRNQNSNSVINILQKKYIFLYNWKYIIFIN